MYCCCWQDRMWGILIDSWSSYAMEYFCGLSCAQNAFLWWSAESPILVSRKSTRSCRSNHWINACANLQWKSDPTVQWDTKVDSTKGDNETKDENSLMRPSDSRWFKYTSFLVSLGLSNRYQVQSITACRTMRKLHFRHDNTLNWTVEFGKSMVWFAMHLSRYEHSLCCAHRRCSVAHWLGVNCKEEEQAILEFYKKLVVRL